MHLLYVFLNLFLSSLETDFSYLISEHSLFKAQKKNKLKPKENVTQPYIYSNNYVGVKIPMDITVTNLQ